MGGAAQPLLLFAECKECRAACSSSATSLLATAGSGRGRPPGRRSQTA